VMPPGGGICLGLSPPAEPCGRPGQNGPMRLVASDLDGTLVLPDGSIADRTMAALRLCRARDVDIVLVTGRPPRWMASIVAATGLGGTAVCGNGAVVYDLDHRRIRQVHTLTPDLVHRVVRLLRESLPGADFAVETAEGFRREPGFPLHHDDAASPSPPEGHLEDLLRDDPAVFKILCRAERGQADRMLALARTVLADIAEPVHSSNAHPMLEISAPGVSKASTLAEIIRERGLTSDDVIAFGDMPNDVPMLRWAGRGYAMADGHAEAIAAADDIAPPCAEDGVAQILESLLADQGNPD
jgi:Cof subfamily protein (haloacid dehalogenase superfamily)